ncbi:hypothetical protein HOB30_03690 [Candidatus Falkowbacteria bacterium]|nr:hypothetical protein [Candidatus Falkowbacteria bacterium]
MKVLFLDAYKYEFTTYIPELHKEKVRKFCFWKEITGKKKASFGRFKEMMDSSMELPEEDLLICSEHGYHKDLAKAACKLLLFPPQFERPDKAGDCHRGKITEWESHGFRVWSDEPDFEIMRALKMDAIDPSTKKLVKLS